MEKPAVDKERLAGGGLQESLALLRSDPKAAHELDREGWDCPSPEDLGPEQGCAAILTLRNVQLQQHLAGVPCAHDDIDIGNGGLNPLQPDRRAADQPPGILHPRQSISHHCQGLHDKGGKMKRGWGGHDRRTCFANVGIMPS